MMRLATLLLGTIAILCLGCAPDRVESITLATTTSTRDSGLLDTLLPRFTKQTGIEVKVLAVGSGQALELGRRGDADVLLTHAPAAEEELVAEGYGQRQPVMHNDFVVVGPASDAANIRGEPSAAAAFARIARSQAAFLSRGDNSGTHMKERSIWEKADLEPQGDWYVEGGSGMAQTLRIASEKRAYTLTDRATFLAQRDTLALALLSEGDDLLRNDYSVIVISAKKHPQLNRAGAERFAEFLLSPSTQKDIAAFGVDKFGQPLFFPDAVPQQNETR